MNARERPNALLLRTGHQRRHHPGRLQKNTLANPCIVLGRNMPGTSLARQECPT